MTNEHVNGSEHEHEHDHGPECTCGCHGHDHDNDQEHEHEHHHGHEEAVELSWAHVTFEAHTHEQAATVSIDIRPNDSSPIVFSNLVSIMREIAHAAEQAGGIVGHIKAFAKQGETFARASVTAAGLPPTYDGDQALALDASTEIQLVAIVLLVDQATLLAICKETLAQTIPSPCA